MVVYFVSDFELVIRCIAVLLSFLCSGAIAWLVIEKVEPRALYLYLFAAIAIFTIDRGLILWLAFQTIPEQQAAVPWIGPANAVATCAALFGVLLITLYRVKVARIQKRLRKTAE